VRIVTGCWLDDRDSFKSGDPGSLISTISNDQYSDHSDYLNTGGLILTVKPGYLRKSSD
jgi:hypothetical protein